MTVGVGAALLVEIQKASGLSPEEYRALPHFQDLMSVNPSEAFRLAGDQAETSLRIIDLIAPIGRGQRGLIVSPPKAGKTTLLEHLGRPSPSTIPRCTSSCCSSTSGRRR